MSKKLTTIDHPIFVESIRYVKAQLGDTGLENLEQEVLARLIHTSGDFGIQPLLRFSPNACKEGLAALKDGAPILTDTAMAAAAIAPMASKTIQPSIHCLLDWAPSIDGYGLTRSAFGIEAAWQQFSQQSLTSSRPPIVVIGSAPTALTSLLKVIVKTGFLPSLIVGMPVGFISVIESKLLLSKSQIPQIRLEGNRGGAALASAAVNALLRASI
ncbi:precorrin-8X methylmutase [Prochlorococcus marinus]|nr:precorrin-8X methylmutase [Prochlorococcus marinus]